MKNELRDLQHRVRSINVRDDNPAQAIIDLRDLVDDLIDEIERIDKAANFNDP